MFRNSPEARCERVSPDSPGILRAKWRRFSVIRSEQLIDLKLLFPNPLLRGQFVMKHSAIGARGLMLVDGGGITSDLSPLIASLVRHSGALIRCRRFENCLCSNAPLTEENLKKMSRDLAPFCL